MEKVLEYISLNYTWFLFGAIIILLAIIGRYADKTNFGQGKVKEEKSKEKNIDLQDITLKEYIDQNKETRKEELKEEIKDSNIVVENNLNQNNVVLQNNLNQQNVNDSHLQNQTIIDFNIKDLNNSMDLKSEQNKIFEESFEKLDEEFDLILPKKQVMDTDLLEDIDNLSLDNTQKISITDIPDLDDVDLPEIKKLKPEKEDIWKF